MVSPQANKTNVTLEAVIRRGAEAFDAADLYYGHGTDNAWDEAVMLALHTLQLPMTVSQEEGARILTETELNTINNLYEARLTTKKPAAYLINKAWFAGLPFYVDERVLIPRSPIAELIEQHFDVWIDPTRVSAILDMCTGSGCIAIACAKAFPDALVDAVDISLDALDVANINCKVHAVTDRCHLIESDLFKAIEPRAQYDVIVSNPPYVAEGEWKRLPNEYHQEPKLGLVSDNNGLAATITILREAARYLSQEGLLIVEVGYTDEALQAHFPEVPFLWCEFEYGGRGVFVMRREDLIKYAHHWAK